MSTGLTNLKKNVIFFHYGKNFRLAFLNENILFKNGVLECTTQRENFAAGTENRRGDYAPHPGGSALHPQGETGRSGEDHDRRGHAVPQRDAVDGYLPPADARRIHPK